MRLNWLSLLLVKFITQYVEHIAVNLKGLHAKIILSAHHLLVNVLINI